MPHRHGLRTLLLATIPVTVGFFGCGKKGLEGPEAEVKATTVKVDIPAIPDFALPAAQPDSHSVKELRVKGKKLLDTDLTVKGVITWVYDCATTIRTAEQTDKDVADLIEKEPEKCERQKFYIGDAKDTPIEKSLWIVDVPRPFNSGERKAKSFREDVKNPPPDRCDDKDTKSKLCPVYQVGDTVTITGSFKLSSPHSERNSDGLVVYKVMKNETQAWESPPPVAEKPGTPAKPGATPPATKAPPGGKG